MKDEIFTKLPKLKGTKFETISIKHDMTPLERQAHIRLVNKAKILNEEVAKKENPEKVEYRVRGPPWRKYVAKLKPRSNGNGKFEVLEILYEKDLQNLPATSK